MAQPSQMVGDPELFTLEWGRRYSLSVFNFGLACCSVEFAAATMAWPDLLRSAAALAAADTPPGPASDESIEVMVISGTLTDAMAPALRRIYDESPRPPRVISFGACANTGGPYWDSYSVTKGVDQLVPVDVSVPGCPPRPEALLHGLRRLAEKITA